MNENNLISRILVLGHYAFFLELFFVLFVLLINGKKRKYFTLKINGVKRKSKRILFLQFFDFIIGKALCASFILKKIFDDLLSECFSMLAMCIR